MQIVTENTIFQMHTVVALGTFDGLHHAHCRIIERAKEIARQKGLCSMVYTFSNLPSAHFGGEQYVLFTEKEKIALFENVTQKYDKFSYFIIPKANHSFNGFENTIA